MDIHATLRQFGLKDAEIDLYLVLLSYGKAVASQMARTIGQNRSTTRYILENLVKKGFATQEMKENTFYFIAKPPKDLHFLLHDEKKQLKKKENALQTVMEDLIRLQSKNNKIAGVQFFEGMSGMRKMFEDFLHFSQRTQGNLYGFSNLTRNMFTPGFWKFIDEEYVPARIKYGSKAFMIFKDGPDTPFYLKNDEKMQRTSLIVNADDFPFRTCFHIYGKKVAFYSANKGERSAGVIIKQEHIAKDQFLLFKMAWNFAKNLPANKHYNGVAL